MKKLLMLLFVGVLTSTLFGQEEDQYHFDDYFQPVFDDMFGNLDEPIYIPESGPPSDPPVPLDGGLTALLVAGSSIGYKHYRSRKKKVRQ